MNGYELWTNLGLLAFVLLFGILVACRKGLRKPKILYAFLAFVFGIDFIRDLFFEGTNYHAVLSGIAFVVALLVALGSRKLGD